MATSDSPTFSPTIIPTDEDSSTQSLRLRNEALIIASCSIFLYGLVFCIALYYYIKFVKLEEKSLVNANLTHYSRYDYSKKLFFGILAISSLLEIPTYFGCLANNGPTDCEWRAFDEVLFWFFHLFALCGYACCIVIPCVMWSDMINKNDGKLFLSKFPYDPIKQYFRLLIVLYFVNAIIDIIMTLIYWRQSNRLNYREAPTYSVCALLECIFIVFLSTGCLYCGIRLECYVHGAKLKRNIEMKFLFTLNIILTMIVLSFIGRAALVIRFAPGIPKSYHHPVNYTVFTLIARWTPDVFCQLFLILIMRLSSTEAKAKNAKVTGDDVISSKDAKKFNTFIPKVSLLSEDDYSQSSSEIPLLKEDLLMKYRIVPTRGRRFDSENFDPVLPFQGITFSNSRKVDSDDDRSDDRPSAIDIKSESIVSSLTHSGGTYWRRKGKDEEESSGDRSEYQLEKEIEEDIVLLSERFYSSEMGHYDDEEDL